MGKHKSGEDNGASGSTVKRKKLSEKDNFTSTEFRKMLSTFGDNKGCQALQRFNRACGNYKKNSDECHDIVKAYIILSPDCIEIFQFLRKGKPSVNEVSLVFHNTILIVIS